MFMFSPAGLILIGIALLVVAIVLLIKHWDDVKVAAIKAWNGIKDIMESVINWAIDKINKWINLLPDFIKDKFGIKAIAKVEFADTPLPPPPGANMSIQPDPNLFGGGLPFMQNQTINADITINDVPPGNEAQAGEDMVEQLKNLGVSPRGG